MDRYQQKLSAYKDVSVSTTVLAADNLSATPRVLVAAKAGETIYVQRVTFNVFVDNAATQLVEDTAATPVIVASPKASPGLGPITWDFGPDGFACTEGKGLELKNSGAGLGTIIQVQAYQKRTLVLVGNKTVPANAPVVPQP